MPEKVKIPKCFNCVFSGSSYPSTCLKTGDGIFSYRPACINFIPRKYSNTYFHYVVDTPKPKKAAKTGGKLDRR